MGTNEEGSLNIVTLLLTGRATPYLHNGVIYVGDEDHYVRVLLPPNRKPKTRKNLPFRRYRLILLIFLSAPIGSATIRHFSTIGHWSFDIRR